MGRINLTWNDIKRGTPLNTGVITAYTLRTKLFVKHKSDYVKTPIPKAGLETVWKKMIEIDLFMMMSLDPYGGRMSEIPENATAFPHRAGNIYIQDAMHYSLGR